LGERFVISTFFQKRVVSSGGRIEWNQTLRPAASGRYDIEPARRIRLQDPTAKRPESSVSTCMENGGFWV